MNLDEYSNTKLPADWRVTRLLDDVILAEAVDVDDSGENVDRGGIYIPTDVSKSLWRVGVVKMHGPKCSDQIKVGTHIMYPSDKGIRAISIDKKARLIFINEPRIFAIVEKEYDNIKTKKTKTKTKKEK